ncbi:glycosyltransferase 87 family protein [Streptomyces sp. NPDC006879]|uniref:glycosyltransferase 87 family protein n=1 Tax=Streptomyces sp. NPDC006879 TaxID=3364767 RepID=UPI003699D72A
MKRPRPSVWAGRAGRWAWLLAPAPRSWRLLTCAVVLGLVLTSAVLHADGGMDNAFVVKAARALLDGRSPYEDRRFLYLPSAVLMAVPEALLPGWLLRVVAPALACGLLVVGWWCALRLFEVPVRSRFAVGGLCLLVVGYSPVSNLVLLSNWTALSVAALPLALLLAFRGRWLAAGLTVGVAIAAKPMLVPVVLLFVLARKWRALAVVVLVPVCAALLGGLLVPRPLLFFTKTLPFLLGGQDSFALVWDASPVAVLPRLGVPEPLALGVALVGALGGLGAALLRWRAPQQAGSGGVDALCLVETSCATMLAAFLVSRPSFDHYLLLVLPLLLASGVREGSAPRSPWFWVALVPQFGVVRWAFLSGSGHRAFKDCFTLCVLAVTSVRRCAAPPRGTVGGAQPARIPHQPTASGRAPATESSRF